MSENWIVLVPEQPGFVPADEAQASAAQLFRSLAPNASEVNATVTEQIQFVDCGGNFERVVCPACGKEINSQWWSDCMSQDYDGGFAMRRYQLPCCGAERSLDELYYEWPQGFARFRLEARNPDVGDLTDEQMKVFEAILGSRLRKILRHI